MIILLQEMSRKLGKAYRQIEWSCQISLSVSRKVLIYEVFSYPCYEFELIFSMVQIYKIYISIYIYNILKKCKKPVHFFCTFLLQGHELTYKHQAQRVQLLF